MTPTFQGMSVDPGVRQST